MRVGWSEVVRWVVAEFDGLQPDRHRTEKLPKVAPRKPKEMGPDRQTHNNHDKAAAGSWIENGPRGSRKASKR